MSDLLCRIGWHVGCGKRGRHLHYLEMGSLHCPCESCIQMRLWIIRNDFIRRRALMSLPAQPFNLEGEE